MLPYFYLSTLVEKSDCGENNLITLFFFSSIICHFPIPSETWLFLWRSFPRGRVVIHRLYFYKYFAPKGAFCFFALSPPHPLPLSSPPPLPFTTKNRNQIRKQLSQFTLFSKPQNCRETIQFGLLLYFFQAYKIKPNI